VGAVLAATPLAAPAALGAEPPSFPIRSFEPSGGYFSPTKMPFGEKAILLSLSPEETDFCGLQARPGVPGRADILKSFQESVRLSQGGS
jgi:hypothetical protein